MFKFFKQKKNHRYIVQYTIDGQTKFWISKAPHSNLYAAVWRFRWGFLPNQVKVVATFKILTPQEAYDNKRKGLDRMHIEMQRELARLHSKMISKH